MTDQEKIAYFRAHGWQARPYPMTMVPLFDAVRAGVPDSYTDSQPELAPIPKEYVDGECWLVEVRGVIYIIRCNSRKISLGREIILNFLAFRVIKKRVRRGLFS